MADRPTAIPIRLVCPQLLISLWHLGLVFLAQGQYGRATEELEAARGLSAESPQLIAALGHCYAVQGQIAQAEAYLRNA